MFVHRDEYYLSTEAEKEAVKGQGDIIVAKQRNGPVGDIKVTWLHKYTRLRRRRPRPLRRTRRFQCFSGRVLIEGNLAERR